MAPVTACASSEKRLQAVSTFGSKNIAWAVVAVRLSSFDTLIARHDLKVLRETLGDVSKSVASSDPLVDRTFQVSVHSSTRSFVARRSSARTLTRCPGAQGLFSETTPSGQRLAGRILQTFPDTRGCVRAVSVPSENGVFNQLTMSLCFLTAISGNPQLRTATSTHIDLASDQPCGLAVTWTVHFLQRQPGATMDNVFLARGRQRACRHKMVCYPLQTAGPVYGLFSLLMATALHLLPRTMDFFLAGGNRCAHQ